MALQFALQKRGHWGQAAKRGVTAMQIYTLKVLRPKKANASMKQSEVPDISATLGSKKEGEVTQSTGRSDVQHP